MYCFAPQVTVTSCRISRQMVGKEKGRVCGHSPRPRSATRNGRMLFCNIRDVNRRCVAQFAASQMPNQSIPGSGDPFLPGAQRRATPARSYA